MSGLGGENIRRAGLDEFVGLVTPCQCWIPVFSEKEKKKSETLGMDAYFFACLCLQSSSPESTTLCILTAFLHKEMDIYNTRCRDDICSWQE